METTTVKPKKEKYVIAFKKQNNQPGKYAVHVSVMATGLMDALKREAKKIVKWNSVAHIKEKEIKEEYVVALKKDNNNLYGFSLEIIVEATGFKDAAKRIVKLLKS